MIELTVDDVDNLRYHLPHGIRLMTYSGRFMYGTRVIAFDVGREESVVSVGAAWVQAGLEPRDVPTTTDSLGMGTVVYHTTKNATDEALEYVEEDSDEEYVEEDSDE